MNSKGFTLIEVLISLVILSFLSYFTYQSIKRGVNFKNKAQEKIDQRTALNNAMKIMERDINLAFNYQDFYYEIDVQIEKEQYEAQTKNPPKPLSGAPPPAPVAPFQSKLKPPPKYTQFLGDAEVLTFTNLNHLKMSEDAKESDQQVVSYSMKACKKLVNQNLKGGESCLWRRTNPIIDKNIEQNGDEIVLLEGVTELHFRYFGKPKTEWVSTWYSNERGDVETRDRFPEAVEVTLVTNWNEHTMSAIRVIPLRFPNNKETKEGTNGQDPNQPKAP